MKILHVGWIGKQGLDDPDKFPSLAIGILATFMAITMWMRLEDVCITNKWIRKKIRTGISVRKLSKIQLYDSPIQ